MVEHHENNANPAEKIQLGKSAFALDDIIPYRGRKPFYGASVVTVAILLCLSLSQVFFAPRRNKIMFFFG